MLLERQSFLVVGLSRSGSASAQYLKTHGAAEVYIYDDVDDRNVRETVQALAAIGCRTVSKEELAVMCDKCDVLVLSPGIPIDHALPVAFRRAGKRIVGEAEIGVRALHCPVVAVTGTNGKTTTVTMIDEILRAAGKKSVACGNVGKPVTSVVDELGDNGIAVTEISSFQLETLYSLTPHVAVVLNVTEDHLNRHYSMDNYIFLKSRILKNSTESEYAVLNYDDPIVRGFAEKTKAKIVYFSTREHVDGGYIEDGNFCYKGEKIFPVSEFPLDGEHNLSNALASVCAAKLMGAGNAAIVAALKSFRGIRHRLQKVGELNGVTFIDDSKATNVDSTAKAIASVKGESVLLLGGKDKGYDYEPLFEQIKRSGVSHVVLYGENAFHILNAALKSSYSAVTLCRPFEIAVRVAFMTARKGQNVLLSPASASFDSFKSYEERGDRFIELFGQLRSETGREQLATEGVREEFYLG